MLPLLLSSGMIVSKCGQRGAKQEQSSVLAGWFDELGIRVESQRILWVDGLQLGHWSNFCQIGMSTSVGKLCVLGLRGKRLNQLQHTTSSVEIGRTLGGYFLLELRGKHLVSGWIPAIQ